MIYQILEKDYTGSFFNSWPNLKIINNTNEIDNSVPLITASDVNRSYVRDRLNKKSPTIYIGRGYLGNHLTKSRQWWRYSINSWANIKMHPIPYSRWDSLKLPKHPWKVKKVKNVLIAPSKATQRVWDPILSKPWPETMIDKFPGAEIKIRYKPAKSGLRYQTLFDDLEWADLVVAQGSAITTEAFWYGKKVISLYPCPTWASKKFTLEDWQDPTEPENRDEWHEHIAWSQFKISEWETGEALELLESYMPPVVNYDDNYIYKFN